MVNSALLNGYLAVPGGMWTVSALATEGVQVGPVVAGGI